MASRCYRVWVTTAGYVLCTVHHASASNSTTALKKRVQTLITLSQAFHISSPEPLELQAVETSSNFAYFICKNGSTGSPAMFDWSLIFQDTYHKAITGSCRRNKKITSGNFTSHTERLCDLHCTTLGCLHPITCKIALNCLACCFQWSLSALLGFKALLPHSKFIQIQL